MNNSYSSRKKKIYHDYSSFHDDRLIEMVRNSREYNTEVIEVIKDILTERNVTVTEFEKSVYSFTAGEPESEMPPESPSKYDYSSEFKNDEKTRSFADKLREKEPAEILATITRYSEFRPEALEAALTVAVDRGLDLMGSEEPFGRSDSFQFIASLEAGWPFRMGEQQCLC